MIRQKNTGKTMELLAPAGSFAAFEAAISEGADAIYVGAPGLNARALSRDFTYPEIASMVKYAHGHDVKLFIAMNTLVKEDELGKVVEGLAAFDALKPDALIIQDAGLMKLATRYFPALPLHASTLFSIHNSIAVKQMVDLGFARIVLPRELTIDEIRSVYKETGAELEIFVHGAMCFSYSGLCLFSSMHGGKSSLRGQCVQPCRRRYSWLKKNVGKKGSAAEKGGGYLFSMHDLSGIELLPQLYKAGVACLKIEGRMKSAEYVRKTVRAYRLLLDGQTGGKRPGQKMLQEARKLLDEAMGRRRTTGFFKNRKPEKAVDPNLSGNIGTMVGKVKRLDEKRLGHARFQSLLTVQLLREIRTGDRLRLHDDATGERVGFSLRTLKQGKNFVKQAGPGRNVTVVLEQAVPKRKGKVFHGSLFRVDSGSRGSEEKESKNRILGSRRRAVQSDQRRVKQVLQQVIGTGKGEGQNAQSSVAKKVQWWVQVASLYDIHLRLPVRPARYIVPLSPENMELLQRRREQAGKDSPQIVWSLPPVILADELDWYSDTVAALVSAGFAGFQLGHFSQRGLFAKYLAEPGRIHLSGSYSFNMLNSMGLQALFELGFSALQFSIETDRENLFLALKNLRNSESTGQKTSGYHGVGLYVFGRPPLFTSRLDDHRYKYGKRFKSPRGEVFSLTRSGSLTCARSVLFFSLLRWQRELGKTGVDYLVADLSEGNIRKNVAEFTAQYFQRGRGAQVLEGNFQSGLV